MDAVKWLKENVDEVNASILKYGEEHPESMGLGTTVVMALLTKDFLIFVNIGDSSGYVLKNKVLHKITKEHTLVNFLVETGELTPEEAINHPKKNVLMKALGASEKQELDIFDVDPNVDAILLVTDGLTNMLTMDQVEKVLNDALPNIEYQLNQKVEALLTNPGTYQEVINLNEVRDVSLHGFKVTLNSNDCYITSINEHSIDIDLHAKVEFSVSVEYLDIESSCYDREYDQWLVRNYEFNNIVRSDNIVVKLKYSIDMLHLEVRDYGIDNLEDEINGRIF